MWKGIRIFCNSCPLDPARRSIEVVLGVKTPLSIDLALHPANLAEILEK